MFVLIDVDDLTIKLLLPFSSAFGAARTACPPKPTITSELYENKNEIVTCTSMYSLLWLVQVLCCLS